MSTSICSLLAISAGSIYLRESVNARIAEELRETKSDMQEAQKLLDIIRNQVRLSQF